MINGQIMNNFDLCVHVESRLLIDSPNYDHTTYKYPMDIEETCRQQARFLAALVVTLRKKAIIIDSEIEDII